MPKCTANAFSLKGYDPFTSPTPLARLWNPKDLGRRYTRGLSKTLCFDLGSTVFRHHDLKVDAHFQLTSPNPPTFREEP